MKKILAISLVLLVFFSTFTVFLSKVNAQDAHEQLTTNPDTDKHPSWSPDGTKIAWVAYEGDWYRHIWVMNSDGTGKTQLTSGDIVDEGPVFSPDGTKIAFMRWGFRGDYFDLMIMNADGTNVQRITFSGIPGKTEGTYHHPQFSQDGSKLLFYYGEGTTGVDKPWWICTMKTDGGDVKVLGRGACPTFCYGDAKILFGTDPFLGDQRIGIMNADGTNIAYLTEGPNDRIPDMSASSSKIIFTRGLGDLYMMNEDGSNLLPILCDGANRMARWSPDERHIVYTSGKSGNYDIWKMDAPPVMPETVIFEDDFEAYSVGSFPSAGGWELVWNGKGTQYQFVTDAISYSPSRSLQLWGQPGWSANVQRKFSSNAETIGFEAYVRAESNTGTGWKVASVCFWKLESEVPWGKRFADIAFGPDGELYTRPVKGSSSFVPLGLTYEADTWYKVRVVIDRTVETYDVWIDDALVAEDVEIWDTSEIDALMLESGHSEVKVYFDDVTVFEVAYAPELHVPPFSLSLFEVRMPFATVDEAHSYIVDAIETGQPDVSNFGIASFNLDITNTGNFDAKEVKVDVRVELGSQTYSDTDWSRPAGEKNLIELTSLPTEPYALETILVGDISPSETRTIKVDVPIKFASVYIHRNFPYEVFIFPPVQVAVAGWVHVEVSAMNVDLVKEQHVILNGFDLRLIAGLPTDIILKIILETLMDKVQDAFIADVVSPAHLHVFDMSGNHVGFNPDGTVDYNIPDTFFIPIEPNRELIMILDPTGDYILRVEGTHSGMFDLSIMHFEDEIVRVYEDIPETETLSAEICLSTVAPDYSMRIDSNGDGIFEDTIDPRIWQSVFEDLKRGTLLRINTNDQYFQFISPEKTFKIKHDADMYVHEYQCFTSILICYRDDEIRLLAHVVDSRFDFCFAYAKDMETGDRYLLIDKPGTE